MRIASPKLLYLIIVVLLFAISSVPAQKARITKTKITKTETISTNNLPLMKIQEEILTEVNILRSNPQTYLVILEKMRQEIKDNIVRMPNGTMWKMTEGISALDDAINSLKKFQKVKAFVFTNGLANAANLQLTDLQENMSLGHRGKDGGDVETRLNRFGYAGSIYSENIAYHSKDAQSVILTMLIDDNYKSRNHRKNLLSPQFSQIGIAFGNGKNDVSLCVMVFADGFMENIK